MASKTAFFYFLVLACFVHSLQSAIVKREANDAPGSESPLNIENPLNKFEEVIGSLNPNTFFNIFNKFLQPPKN
ncbi:hypothetical protein KGM_211062 [Danaus plexippus plexippus]|uniref:Uncharacterized protein n=1 Tax=Danaus plexippus plexippus TaxID=278856 RepID=A0A212FLF1_DANPL|nr:hypothetical protein KGM_211062 [Danaus plexippus plexippus]